MIKSEIWDDYFSFMFWFTREKFVGSYRFFTATKRPYVANP
jgi:hypothetical protein